MFTNVLSRSVVLGLFLLAGLLVFATGCPGPSEDGSPTTTAPQPSPDKPDPVVEPPVEQPPVEEPPVEEPPVEEPPIEQPPVEQPGDTPNPLRDDDTATGNGNSHEDEASTTENQPAEPAHNHDHAHAHAHDDDQQPFDPIEENGPIFVDWPKPKLAILISGRQEGYIEPCGCAGLDRMKGGMSRRHSLFKQLRQKGWPLVGVDVGGLAKGSGRQTELKFQVMVESIRKMQYDAIALGKTDLRLPAGELFVAAASDSSQQSPFLSANVGLLGFDADQTDDWRIVERGGMKLGITAVLGKTFQKEINNDEIEMADPAEKLAEVLPQIKDKADYLILLAHATREESIALAKQFSDFDLVVTAGGAAEPPAVAAKIDGNDTLLVEVGEKGMNAVVLGIYDESERTVRYQRVPLDSRFEASEDMRLLMESYQNQLKGLGFSGLGIRAVPHPMRETNGTYVGSKKCESCHEPSYDIWKKSGHARAFATLNDLKPPRHHDPECISCHVIGWHPTSYFPYEGGYQSAEKTPKLIDVGCESCHGPGSGHIDAEAGADLALQERMQKAMIVTKAEAADIHSAKRCTVCHDGDNSPDFTFEKYWPKIEHYESE